VVQEVLVEALNYKHVDEKLQFAHHDDDLLQMSNDDRRGVEK